MADLQGRQSESQSTSLRQLFRSQNYKWYIVGMLWFISFFNYADRQALSAVVPLLREELQLSDVELGWLSSSFAWVYGLSAPVAGIIIDRVRRKSAILAGLHVWSLICVATGAARTYGQLLFFRAAEGLGETFYYPASMSLLSDYHGKSTRSRALGLHQTSVYAGTIGGSFFAGLIGQHYGWRYSFYVFGGLGIILGLLLGRFMAEPTRGAADKNEDDAASDGEAREKAKLQVVRHSITRDQDGSEPAAEPPLAAVIRLLLALPTVMMLMLAFMCAMFVNMVLLAWMPDFLGSKFKLGLAGSALTATAFAQIASMIGAPLGGWLADVWRKHTVRSRILVQAFGVLAGAPFVYWCGQSSSIAGVIVALTAWGLFKGIYDANIFASVYDVVPAELRASVAGFMNMTGWLAGGASAPVVVGYLSKQHGQSWAISATASVYVLSGVLLLVAGFVFLKRDLARQKNP